MRQTLPPSPSSAALRRLRERAGEARNAPGVYRFLGARGEVLYVGKSVTLRRRILSYFRPGGGTKERELVRAAAGVEWEYLPSELEALLQEYRLIRTFQPRFNRRHRRLRRYAWIRITPGAAPRLRATRAPSADGSRYFGPFPAPAGLPDLLRELARTVGLEEPVPGASPRLSDQLDLLGGGPGPGTPTEAVVRDRVSAVVGFLEGGNDRPLEELRERMADATRERRYELAARLRDREERLRGLRDEVVGVREALGRLSCIYLPAVPADSGRAEGDPSPLGYLLAGGRIRFRFERPGPEGTALRGRARSRARIGAQIRTQVRTLAAEPLPPPEALGATEREEAFVVARWFRANPAEWERTLPVERFLAE